LLESLLELLRADSCWNIDLCQRLTESQA